MTNGKTDSHAYADGMPLYTAQQPRKAVKLSDTTIDDVTKAQWGHDQTYAAHRAYARAIEQAVWEKLGVTE